MTTTGLLLAAGGGRRMGRPKALVEGWLARSLETLAECDDVVVVLGAAADEVRRLLPAVPPPTVVVNGDWASGMGSSLAVGLQEVARGGATRCLVTLVDLVDVGPEVVRRLLARRADPGALLRASYAGTPGHPVVIGRDHWAGVRAGATGDQGARAYLAAHDVTLVECGDLATGADQDTPAGPRTT